MLQRRERHRKRIDEYALEPLTARVVGADRTRDGAAAQKLRQFVGCARRHQYVLVDRPPLASPFTPATIADAAAAMMRLSPSSVTRSKPFRTMSRAYSTEPVWMPQRRPAALHFR